MKTTRFARWGSAILLYAACAAAQAADQAASPAQVLAEWVVAGDRLPAGAKCWPWEAPDTRAQLTTEPALAYPGGTGAFRAEILESPGTVATGIQVYFVTGQALGRGGRYRVSFQVKASRNTTFEAAVIRDAAPWTALSEASRTEVEATSEWRPYRIDFSPDEDLTPDDEIRAPYLGLGLVPAGTTIWVAGVTLAEVTPPPPPVPLIRSDELLENPGFEAGLAGWTAQAAELSPAGPAYAGNSACRASQRTARWGTPVQDVRAALLRQGQGYYELGAMLRTVSGKADGLAVLHTRDAAGDHWVTSDTRRVDDTGYTRLAAHKLITWSGELQAADLGAQTTGDSVMDVLVDDVTLRALTDLARGRPCTSSGDAAGHPASSAVDGDAATSWSAAAAGEPWLEVDLGRTVAFNTCLLGSGSTAVGAYELEAWDGGAWRTVFSGGGILGPLDQLHFAPAEGSKVRLRFTAAAAAPEISDLGLYTTAIRERTLRLPQPPADPTQRGPRTLVGAIRWDGWCGDLGPVGLDLERVMAPERYHFRLPFYAQILGPNQIQARCTSQEVMDREIAYAKAAGIDYWAFDWYQPGTGLARARELYLASQHRNEVNWCLVMGTGGLPDADRAWLVGQFGTPNYQKVLGGRPLVYIFEASRKDAPLVQALRAETAAAGLPTPFVVFMGWGPQVAEPAAACGADALGAYVNPVGQRSTFAANMAHERGRWEALRQTGRQMVPTVTTGWDTRPFFDCPVPWYPNTPEGNWVETAEPEQIAAQLRAALDFTAGHPESTLANTVLIYAWNENAEGGWLVPTLYELRDEGRPARLDAVRQAVKPDGGR